MKIKIGLVILVVVCVGLAIALIATKKQADEAHKKNVDAALDLSNQVMSASDEVNGLRQVNLMLTNDLAVSRAEALTFSNNLAEADGALTEVKASLQNAQDQIANLNGRVSDLETQNKVLDDRASSLSNTIVSLNLQIAQTQRQLASSQTNNAFLTAELQKQMAQKAELQRQFNDLDQVRAQVKKLRDELFIARRLQWMSAGNDPSTPQKGAELLVQPHPATAAARLPHYDLNVEVGSDGSVHIIPPVTNAPAMTNSLP
jgi:ubiquinone biosynthesis protein UbiJ